MKEASIALAVEIKQGVPFLVDALSDSREIQLLQSFVASGEEHPLSRVYEHRARQLREDDAFSDYVEDLLCRPFLKQDVQDHGVQWLKSRIRIEKFQQDETDAAQIIANYAFEIFCKKSEMTDFFLAGPKSQVRIQVFVVDSDNQVKAA